MERLKGRSAIVIGAAQGIGAGIARLFAAEGARLVLADISDEKGRKLAEALRAKGAEALFVAADVSLPADTERLAEAAMAAYGRIDVLVQNAAIYPYMLIEDTSPADWDRVLAVNLKGTFLATKACVAHMKRQRYGRIVFTSSITGPRVSMPGHGHYAASKAGINGFIRTAALEFAPYEITVNGVEPGNIATEGVRAHREPSFIRAMERSVPLGRLGTPEDVAYATLFLASDEAAYITGTTIVVDGGQILSEAKVE